MVITSNPVGWGQLELEARYLLLFHDFLSQSPGEGERSGVCVHTCESALISFSFTQQLDGVLMGGGGGGGGGILESSVILTC